MSDSVDATQLSRRHHILVLIGVVAVGGVALGLWFGRPQVSEVEVRPPGICNHHADPPGRPAALVSGMGPFEMIGVVYGGDLLISSDWDASPGSALVPVGSDSDHGWLRISEGWFGIDSEYSFRADDGRVTDLKPTSRFIVGCNGGDLGY